MEKSGASHKLSVNESDGNQERAAQEYVGELMEKASSAGHLSQITPSPDKKPSAREEENLPQEQDHGTQ